MKAAGETARPGRPWRRRLTLATVACAGGLILGLAALLVLDLWTHHKFDEIAGVNIWGYRGPAVGRKSADEYRIVVLGSSVVFGYGVGWHDAFPARLEQKLRKTNRRFSVVNLGYNNEGSYSYQFTLRDYAYLKPDLAILSMGILDGRNTSIFRRESPVFRLTGYYPLLPIVAWEKAMAMRYGGDLNRAYSGAAPIVRPSLAVRSATSAVTAMVAAGSVMGRQVGRFRPDSSLPRPDVGNPWDPDNLVRSTALFQTAITRAVGVALDQGISVLVVGQPNGGEGNTTLQELIQQTLARGPKQHPWVHYIDLSRAVDTRDRSITFDGMHLTVSGHDRIAESLVQPVLDIATRGGSTTASRVR